jgi:hypothetical protein
MRTRTNSEGTVLTISHRIRRGSMVTVTSFEAGSPLAFLILPYEHPFGLSNERRGVRDFVVRIRRSEPQIPAPDGRLGAGGDRKLLQDMRHVAFDRLRSDVEFRTNLRVRAPADD